ncbi:uncharacterized protein RHO25_004318 [Cercospora beticola]|uniref:Uncharacterized protein n=1 Tax=Cercospora beticola TaxID=122368 RepID=A0ABZ0NJP9_CERBT|nr:hypothetical protein RHO25_004318 [Cercospora beticola]CAK1362154.1 unnamed protein product [Cercospora beticola]
MVSFGLGLLGTSLLALLSPTVAGSLDSFDDSSLPDDRPVGASVNAKLPPGFPTDVPASTTFTLPPTAEAILPAGASGDSGASATLSWEPAVRTEPGNRRISPYVKDIPGSPVTTGTPEICTPMTCTQSYFNQEVVSTDKCNFIYESTSWRCSKSTAYTSKCLDYAKPLTDCLYYGTEVSVGSWVEPGPFAVFGAPGKTLYDTVTPRSATVTPTFRPDNQKFQIFLDEPTKGFLSRLAATYCQGQWCENALIHSEIMTHLHLNGFTADRIRGWNLDNTNEYVLEDNNATEWWATNAMADYVAQEYIHNRPLSNTIIIDEMLQGLESEKLAEYNEDESPTTSTATVPEAPTLTPACQLSSGEPMASADVVALASALEWRFGQMVMKPKPTLSCVNFVIDVARLGCLCNMSTTTGTFSHSTRTYTTTERGSASVVTDVCGGYTTWPKISTRSLTPNPTISPIPLETMRCETAEVGWLSPSYDKCANAFCSAAVIGQWYARDPEMHGKLRWRCPIPGTETYPRNRGLVFLIHFEDRACPPGRPHDVEFENEETADYDISDETCMETFTRLKSCKFAMKKDGKYYFTGGGVYSQCLWWRAYWPGREHDTPGLEKLAGDMDEFQMNLTRHADEEYWRLTDAEQHWANGTARLASDESINLMNGTRGNATSTDLVTSTKAAAENDMNERV